MRCLTPNSPAFAPEHAEKGEPQPRIGVTRVRATVPMEIDAPRELLAETRHAIRERLAALARYTGEPIANDG